MSNGLIPALIAVTSGCAAACPPCASTAVEAASAPAMHPSPPETASPAAGPPVGELQAASPEPSGASRETRTTEVIAAVIAAHRPAFRRCYDADQAGVPALAGTLTLRFTLDPQGKVTAAAINPQRSTIHSPSLADCAIDVLRRLPF